MIEDQPPPVPNTERPSWELVIEDMQERHRIGVERYGTALQPGNGRDSLVDAYQELLDGAVYLRNEIEERKRLRPSGIRLQHIRELSHAIGAYDGAEATPPPGSTLATLLTAASRVVLDAMANLEEPNEREARLARIEAVYPAAAAEARQAGRTLSTLTPHWHVEGDRCPEFPLHWHVSAGAVAYWPLPRLTFTDKIEVVWPDGLVYRRDLGEEIGRMPRLWHEERWDECAKHGVHAHLRDGSIEFVGGPDRVSPRGRGVA